MSSLGSKLLAQVGQMLSSAMLVPGEEGECLPLHHPAQSQPQYAFVVQMKEREQKWARKRKGGQMDGWIGWMEGK